VQVVTSAICIILAIVYRFVCARENKKRDSTGIAEAFDNAYDDDMTDVKNKQFRYRSIELHNPDRTDNIQIHSLIEQICYVQGSTQYQISHSDVAIVMLTFLTCRP
jgi:hypothetical protein